MTTDSNASRNFLFGILLVLSLLCLALTQPLTAQVYPPDQPLVFHPIPSVAKPGYLNTITDPTFGSRVTRITDAATFNQYHNGLNTYHHYAKTQPWNRDGTLIILTGYPSAILDGKTFEFIRTVTPPGGHHTWSNVHPNIIYGTNHPDYDGNCIAQLDVTTDTRSLVHCFTQYAFVSHGNYEGNMSNDDRYMALQARRSNGAEEIAVFDFTTRSIVASMPAPRWPNNVTMSQSGEYLIVQWDATGRAHGFGTWAYLRSDLSVRRNLSDRGGSHFDYGYDTAGNEVMVGTDETSRAIVMVRLDTGEKTMLLGDNLMSWYQHTSTRNLERPGWAYLTEFADPNTQTFKPNYQKAFAVQLDPNANGNAMTQTFGHVHHSPHVNYDRSPFGVPSRDGSKMMFRSDWEGNASSEINSYVGHMPFKRITVNVSALLQGAYDEASGTMSTELRDAGQLPSINPYKGPPWNHRGNEGSGWQASNYPADAVDWVLLSFRTSPDAASEVAKVAVPILRDGTIAPTQIEIAPGVNALYVVLEHRNHLAVISPTAVPVAGGNLTFDFTAPG